MPDRCKDALMAHFKAEQEVGLLEHSMHLSALEYMNSHAAWARRRYEEADKKRHEAELKALERMVAFHTCLQDED